MNLWDYKKILTSCHWIPDGEEKEGTAEKALKEITAENFPKLAKDINLQIQEAEQIPKKINSKKSTPRHIMVKLLKIKNTKIVEAARNNNLSIEGKQYK